MNRLFIMPSWYEIEASLGAAYGYAITYPPLFQRARGVAGVITGDNFHDFLFAFLDNKRGSILAENY